LRHEDFSAANNEWNKGRDGQIQVEREAKKVLGRRYAVDRAIAQDFRSKDPKWQAFLSTVQDKAEKILGAGLDDNLEDRMESYRRVENHRKKYHKQ